MNDEGIHAEVPSASPPTYQGLKVATGVLAAALGLALIYALVQHRHVQQLAASRDELNASLNQTRSQVEALTAKVNALNSTPPAAASALVRRPAPAASAPALKAAPPVAERVGPRSAKHASVKRQPAEDPRWKKVQTELTEQQKQIAEHRKQIQATQDSVAKTRSELESSLSSTRDELSGSIAKTHEELVALEKKGERNYFEFELGKSKQFRRIGPISLSLRKANIKRQYCDLELLVDDIQLSKKHVNLYESVVFYPQGYTQALELVLNQIGKDEAHGYVSVPKYIQPSEQAANTPAAGTNATPPATQVDLEHRP